MLPNSRCRLIRFHESTPSARLLILAIYGNSMIGFRCNSLWNPCLIKDNLLLRCVISLNYFWCSLFILFNLNFHHTCCSDSMIVDA